MKYAAMEVAKTKHLVHNFEFFKKMRVKIEEDAQIYIAYKYRKRLDKLYK